MLDSKILARMGPNIEPRPNAPVFMALTLFLIWFMSRSLMFRCKNYVKAGTQLLLISAPPTPPKRMPRQMTKTSFGKNGAGPDSIIETINIRAPTKTIF
jgi:hypothetical protein